MENSPESMSVDKQYTANQISPENQDSNKQNNSQNGEKFNLPKNKAGTQYYDCVKIKVYLNEHYYIFSRFMILRILTMCRVNNKIKIK
jgi:hypothetical protein